MPRVIPRMGAIVISIALLDVPPTAAQSSTGVVEGHVVDRQSDHPLPGASVRVDGSNLQATTDRFGAYRLPGVSEGSQTVVAEYLGRSEGRATVTVGVG